VSGAFDLLRAGAASDGVAAVGVAAALGAFADGRRFRVSVFGTAGVAIFEPVLELVVGVATV
jgi:hypothetical protein